jgi:6-phosphogluconolactonase
MTSPSDNRVFDDADALAAAAAEWLCGRALARPGNFSICLSGGSTPRRLYERLAAPVIASRFPWDRSHWFWGDERFVPPDHADSNYRMAHEALLARVPVPAANIHVIPTTRLSPEQSAAAYEETLKQYYGDDQFQQSRPLFDVMLLGIGEDGHTASLFPGQPALHETARWVLAVIGAKPEPRITLTFPALASSRDVVFLATGADKHDVVARAQAGDPALPAGMVRAAGRLRWFTDRAASAGRAP